MSEVKAVGVVEALKEALRAGDLSPGQRLVEAELADGFGVGRGVVREALRHLAAEGLVVIEANRGASIRRLSAQDLAHIYDIRALLEGLAARDVAEQGDDGRVAALWNEMEEAAARVDVGRYISLNGRFHELLIAASANPFLAEATARLRIPVMRYQFKVLMDPDALRHSHADHAAIVTAIAKRDPAGAEAAMRRHIDASRQYVIGAIPR
jgi:DNA-binding GntR family transcriptional regulator